MLDKSLVKYFLFFFIIAELVFISFFLFHFFSEKDNSSLCSDCNVVIIMIDTFRWDHLGAYGYSRNTTPNIDSFANNNLVFERAYSQYPETLGSVTSLFTGFYVFNHKFYSLDFDKSPLSGEFITLPELFSLNNYRTIGFLENPIISSFTGFKQGFDVLVENAHFDNIPVNKTFKFISSDSNSPFFAYIHLFGSHSPYDFPLNESVFSSYANLSQDSLLRNVESFKYNLSNNSDFNLLVDLYDDDVLFLDKQVGSIIDFLNKSNLLEETIVIIISDHGEGLGDLSFDSNILLGHGNNLFDILIHVPLIIHIPGVSSSKESFVVELIDLYPSLADLLGFSLVYELDGESFVPLIGSGYFGGVAVSNFFLKTNFFSFISDDLKIYNNLLFNISSDPYEQEIIYDSVLYSEMARDFDVYNNYHRTIFSNSINIS